MRRRARLASPAAALAAAALAAAGACVDSTQARSGGAAREVDVRAALGPHVPRVAARTRVPVRLPRSLPLDHDGRVYGSGAATRRGWELSLAGAHRCGANACFLASFAAERGGRLSFSRRLRLAGGRSGAYKPLTCGASCAPPEIQWLQSGVRYSIQAKLGVAGAAGQRAALVRAANEAIRSRPA